MYNVKGFVSGTVETAFGVFLLMILNLSITVLAAIILGTLLHIGWNLI